MSFVAKKYKLNYIYVNQVGANDELVYDGLSRMYDKNGKLIAMAPAFEEDLAFTKLNDILSFPKIIVKSSALFKINNGQFISRKDIAQKNIDYI